MSTVSYAPTRQNTQRINKFSQETRARKLYRQSTNISDRIEIENCHFGGAKLEIWYKQPGQYFANLSRVGWS